MPGFQQHFPSAQETKTGRIQIHQHPQSLRQSTLPPKPRPHARSLCGAHTPTCDRHSWTDRHTDAGNTKADTDTHVHKYSPRQTATEECTLFSLGLVKLRLTRPTEADSRIQTPTLDPALLLTQGHKEASTCAPGEPVHTLQVCPCSHWEGRSLGRHTGFSNSPQGWATAASATVARAFLSQQQWGRKV